MARLETRLKLRPANSSWAANASVVVNATNGHGPWFAGSSCTHSKVALGWGDWEGVFVGV